MQTSAIQHVNRLNLKSGPTEKKNRKKGEKEEVDDDDDDDENMKQLYTYRHTIFYMYENRRDALVLQIF